MIVFQGLLVACVTDMLKQMEDHHYKTLLSSYKDRKPLKVSYIYFCLLCANQCTILPGPGWCIVLYN